MLLENGSDRRSSIASASVGKEDRCESFLSLVNWGMEAAEFLFDSIVRTLFALSCLLVIPMLWYDRDP